MHPVRLQALSSIKNLYPNGAPKTQRIPEIFGAYTFGPKEMALRLPKEVVSAFKSAVAGHESLNPKMATQIAEAAKAWALSHGVTHFTHWFQPLTGLTAEKHDSFITLDDNGDALEKFSGGQLIQSEPDASSFPSGGTRSTFEARGYTAWDISSPLFITENGGTKFLCIPSVFVSYTGQSLDTKTALLRSIESLNREALAMLHSMGETKHKRIWATIGCEQEYFLVDAQFIKARPDLALAGRTLIGGDLAKGQQLEDHYFGSIPTRVQAFMVEMEQELYKLGIPVKTRHNEVAPAQFETAPIFEEANIASDHNMMTMEVLRRVAERHGFACLLHEKPFAGINGSGKHNNWSMATDGGENLLEPGKTPAANFRFIAVLSCVLNAVFKHQVALRASIASHGNDHRLGANEAPPAIISVFVGSTLTEILETIEREGDLTKVNAEKAAINFGLNRLPSLPKDNTDRNRTSPFAFTGNKFEYRAVGSSHAISFPVSVLNAAVAESMKAFREALEKKKAGAASLESAILEVAREFIKESSKIRFEGNGYSEEWRTEAKGRGLYEFLKTPESLAALSKLEHHKFLIDMGVYAEKEIESIIHVKFEQYVKHLDIEALSLVNLAQQYVLPTAQKHQESLCQTLLGLKQIGIESSVQKDQLTQLTKNIEKGVELTARLKKEISAAHGEAEPANAAKMFSTKVSSTMAELRALCDGLEAELPDELWPLPKYREMLFVR